MPQHLMTKDRKLEVGEHQNLHLKFSPLEGDELLKEIGMTDLSAVPEGYIAGWASTNDLDHYGDVIMTGAFDESIAMRGLTGPMGIKLLAQHRSDKPAGVIKKLETRNGKLWIEAQMNLAITYVKDLYEAAKMQGGLSFSVGFMLQDFEFKEMDDREILQINKGDLVEVSIVTFPGNDAAEMTFIKAKDGDKPFSTIAAFEKALVGAGIAKSRNDAHRITLWVKGLTPAKEEPVQASKTLDTSKVNSLLGELNDIMKS